MKNYFTPFERGLWLGSCTVILAAYAAFGGGSLMTLAASLVGVTSLIFSAKGNPIGQGLMIVFSLLYGIISYSCRYYGEMATYLGMTGPMAVAALISWLKNPYSGKHSEVKVGRVTLKELPLMLALTAGVTVLFYFILRYFGTARLMLSAFSVTTSFAAVYLTFRRSELFALAYAANDAVLIALWALASAEDSRYISVAVCFVMFLVNDTYGYISWRRMKHRQNFSKK